VKDTIQVQRVARYYATEEEARSAARFLARSEVEFRGFKPVGPPQVKTLGFKVDHGWAASARQHGEEA